MVHRRELNGEELIFGNQGDLYENAMTWFDHGTGSIWSQPTGEAILGPLAGATIELLPSSITTWREWQTRFPETTALDTHTRAPNFDLDDLSAIVVVGDDSAAIPIDVLRREHSITLQVGGEPVFVVLDPLVDRWSAWSLLDDNGDTRSLVVDGAALTDPTSGEQWSVAFGASLDGGEPLDRVPVFSSFIEDYERIFPNGTVIES